MAVRTCSDAQVHIGFGKAQLFEEDRTHGMAEVLPGVHDSRVEQIVLEQRPVNRCDLTKLGRAPATSSMTGLVFTDTRLGGGSEQTVRTGDRRRSKAMPV